MPTNKYLDINDIQLDLKNYRTVPQKTEVDAVKAMIAIKPDRFYAIIDSIIEDGYLPTENLIILKDKGNIVKEGNRRTAALKLIHGVLDKKKFNLPDSLKTKIDSIDPKWITENKKIPCSIYAIKDKSKVDKIINLTHAKGEKASRDPWTSVAKARQNRDEKNGAEPTLDLLEKYLAKGKNLNRQQKERWSGDFPLTVLDEALRTIVGRMGYANIAELAKKYPRTKLRNDLEDMVRDIGLGAFGFKEIRAKTSDFAIQYNIPPVQPNSTTGQNTSKAGETTSSNSGNSTTNANSNQNSSSTSSQNSSSGSTSNAATSKAYAINDQRAVNKTLKSFNPKGNDRQKIVSLRDELRRLKIKDNPIAFCFLLRSMFEISAKIYCKENSIPLATTKNNKTVHKTLKQLLSAVTTKLTSNNSNKGMIKALHGANTELSRQSGLLSVTSMNQLVHNPTFSIAPHDICTLFNNVYPLLEEMN